MKIKSINFYLTVFIFCLLSCESHEQNPDALSYQYKKKAKKIETKRINLDHPFKIKKVKVPAKKEVVIIDEWTQFKQESDNKITANELKIVQLKEIPNKSAKLNKKILRIELENLELRNRIAHFEQEHQNALIAFKENYIRDISKLDFELNSFENPVK